MKLLIIFIFLSILFSLNQAKKLFIKNHDLTINKERVDKYYKVNNNGIGKKKSRQYFFNSKFIKFNFICIILYILACMWRICSWPLRKEKKKSFKTERNGKNFSSFKFKKLKN